MKQREFKFRALRDDMSDCSFVYGSLIYNAEGCPRIQENHGASLFTTCLKGTEGQFTGLLDKNGKEIYEGDLPGDTYESGVVQWCDKCHGWSIGIAEIPGHCHQCDGDFMWLDFVDDVRSGRVEIIGNIHENPELLK